jgi:predicted metal-dependent enzyme (double-stranded beta helix superfamily)
MDQLLQELYSIDWDDPEWRKLATDVLVSADSLADTVAAYMRSWEPAVRAAMMDASHETSSHYKWLTYRSYAPRFTVWLHDYKNASARGPGYAQVPHNHRYDLCSILLTGGYDSVWYNAGQHLTEVRRQTFVAGDVLSMAHDEVHSLTNIVDGTQSLFLEGPPRRNFSTSFPVEGDPQVWVDFDGRWAGTLGRLTAAQR